jgi:hypothetical protein
LNNGGKAGTVTFERWAQRTGRPLQNASAVDAPVVVPEQLLTLEKTVEAG